MKRIFLLLIFLTVSCGKQNLSRVQNIGGFKISCWGDSLINGDGIARYYNYPSILDSLSRSNCFNGGVSGNTSGQIRERMIANSDRKDDDFVIIRVGRNNYLFSDDVKEDIAKMVQYLDYTKYCVLSIVNGDIEIDERKSGIGYDKIIALNNYLKQIYG